jgi:2-dehydro-3-deoxyphosphogluconate aldolase/(4S)-4-hydroxy-2-oxoglutarate aldolase
MNDVLIKIRDFGVVPVISILNAEDASPLGDSLTKAGLSCAEITFRTQAAEEAIRRLANEFPEMLVGAGTVLSVAQAEQAASAGAKFIVTPGFASNVVEWCIEQDIPITPGVATPTEINMALAYKLNILKFFPAEALGGVKMLKAISAPYGGVKFIPTGGINTGNLATYLSLPSVHACGGSWMVKRDMISSGDFGTIHKLVVEAVEIVSETRTKGR